MNPVFNDADVMTMYLQLPKTRYGEIPKQTQFRRELLSRLNSLPGVQAAMVTDIPLGGNYVGHRFVIAGRPPVAVGGEPKVQTLSVMGDYFHVIRLPCVRGATSPPWTAKGNRWWHLYTRKWCGNYFRTKTQSTCAFAGRATQG